MAAIDVRAEPVHHGESIGGHGFDDRGNHCVAELAIGLSVGHDDVRGAANDRIKPHQTGAFEGREAARSGTSPASEQDLGAVLVIPGAQRASDHGRTRLRVHQAVPEPIALRLVLCRVLAKVLPQVGGERVAVAGFWLQNLGEFPPPLSWKGSRAPRGLPTAEELTVEAGDKDSLAMLGDPVRSVDDLVVDGVSKFLGEGAVNDLPSHSFVVRPEVLHILEQKDRRSLDANNVANLEEEIALAFAPKSVSLTK